MSTLNHKTALAAFTGLMFLAGCGGGGVAVTGASGGGAGSAPGPFDDFEAEATFAGIGSAATQDPLEGSVYQASNGEAGSTSVKWNGQAVTVEVGPSAALFSLSAGGSTGVSPICDSTSDSSCEPAAGHHRARQYHMEKEVGAENKISHAIVRISWSTENADSPTTSEWLAAGYWLHETNPSGGTEANVAVGAFVDGPEFADRATAMTATGTAKYYGPYQGIYSDGSGFAAPAEGGVELDANFATTSVSGRIVDVPVGNGVVTLEATTFDKTTGWISPGAVSIPTITGSTGKWGGQFSKEDTGDGEPRRIAGTAGVKWNEGSVVGFFVADEGESE